MTASSATWTKSEDPKRNKVQFNLNDEEYGYFLYAVQLSGVDRAEFCRVAISASASLVLALPWPPGLRPPLPSPAPSPPSRSPKAEQDDHAQSFEFDPDHSIVLATGHVPSSLFPDPSMRRFIAPCFCGDPTHHVSAEILTTGDGHPSRPNAAAPHPLSQGVMQVSDGHSSATASEGIDATAEGSIDGKVTGPSPALTGCG